MVTEWILEGIGWGIKLFSTAFIFSCLVICILSVVAFVATLFGGKEE